MTPQGLPTCTAPGCGSTDVREVEVHMPIPGAAVMSLWATLCNVCHHVSLFTQPRQKPQS
jgi:hypothetical protein